MLELEMMSGIPLIHLISFHSYGSPSSNFCMWSYLIWKYTWGDLADCGRVPTITLITVGALDKDSAITKTLGKHFSPDVVQSHSTA